MDLSADCLVGFTPSQLSVLVRMHSEHKSPKIPYLHQQGIHTITKTD